MGIRHNSSIKITRRSTAVGNPVSIDSEVKLTPKAPVFFTRGFRPIITKPKPDVHVAGLKNARQNGAEIREFFLKFYSFIEKINEGEVISKNGFERGVAALFNGGERTHEHLYFDLNHKNKDYRLHFYANRQPADMFLSQSEPEVTLRLGLQLGNKEELTRENQVFEVNYRFKPGDIKYAAQSQAFFGRDMAETDENEVYGLVNDFCAWFVNPLKQKENQDKVLQAMKKSRPTKEV